MKRVPPAATARPSGRPAAALSVVWRRLSSLRRGTPARGNEPGAAPLWRRSRPHDGRSPPRRQVQPLSRFFVSRFASRPLCRALGLRARHHDATGRESEDTRGRSPGGGSTGTALAGRSKTRPAATGCRTPPPKSRTHENRPSTAPSASTLVTAKPASSVSPTTASPSSCTWTRDARTGVSPDQAPTTDSSRRTIAACWIRPPWCAQDAWVRTRVVLATVRSISRSTTGARAPPVPRPTASASRSTSSPSSSRGGSRRASPTRTSANVIRPRSATTFPPAPRSRSSPRGEVSRPDRLDLCDDLVVDPDHTGHRVVEHGRGVDQRQPPAER